MGRQFPKNVKQIGNVSDTPKIYVEDYVDTFLNQLKESGSESFAGAFLIGERVVIEEQDCIYITGAVQIKEMEEETQELKVGREHLEIARAESRENFHNGEILGWMLLVPDGVLEPKEVVARTHQHLFPERNSVLILKDREDGEEYYTYKFRELMHIGGHYIFYEKNPDMQNYMINERKQIGVTPSEVVEDRAAKNFRSTVRDRMEIREQRRESKYVYLTSVLLVVVVLAIGISTMNNYDKMNSVQTSIETLSAAMQGSDESQEQQKPEVQTGQKVQANDDEQSEKDESSENSSPAGEEGDEGMEPVRSTIQEELGEREYYTVQKGDTLDTISKKLYGTTNEADAICRMNGLEDGNLIFIGQKLLLP